MLSVDYYKKYLTHAVTTKTGKLKKLGRVPKWTYPRTAEIEYNRAINRIIKAIQNYTKVRIIPEIPQYIDESQINLDSANFDDWIDKLIKLSSVVAIGVSEDHVSDIVLSASVATNQHNKAQLYKMVRSVFGVDIFTADPWLKDTVKPFQVRNIALIDKLVKDAQSQIETIIFDAVQTGRSYKSLLPEIEKALNGDKGVFKKLRTRSRLIARDQIGKLNGDLTRLRQKEIGIDTYIWRNSGDIRVRGNPGGLYPKAIPSHWKLEGKVFSWTDPNRQPPKYQHPGQATQCRCYAEANVSDILNY